MRYLMLRTNIRFGRTAPPMVAAAVKGNRLRVLGAILELEPNLRKESTIKAGCYFTLRLPVIGATICSFSSSFSFFKDNAGY